ncbi:phosphatase PAP2 family protein [Variovorax ginsengisoli]|uniref:Undecaprenyl-diphosphatase n=1 Tax=Variovorax ginsengisoli TaxID=363844 RepID=A0ABT9S1I8_9BURK|nr:phosphatase PAP2 family protein [Variovorax ginsengisoli]MDP9898215.1 undecaprenyl-diphosphatase [Variovorax ginsengisoli]
MSTDTSASLAAASLHPLVLFAQKLGEHALAWFLLTLITCVLIGGLACLMADRRRRRQTGAPVADNDQPPRLLAGLVTGFALIGVSAALFALIAEHLGDGRVLGQADQALSDAIGQHVAWNVRVAFSWLTHLGDVETVAVICLGVAGWLWRHAHRSLALGWVLALCGNGLLNPMLKHIFERARPVHDLRLAHETSFSFPSGHTSGAMVTYGMLIYLAVRTLPPRWHAPAVMAAIAALLTIAFSRIFLQVHFASDVAAGLVSGFAWVTVCVLSIEYAQHRYTRRRR